MKRFAAAVLASALLALGLASAGAAERYEPRGGWRSTLLTKHPLVSTQWVAVPAATDQIASFHCPKYLLIGESHDNPDHHLLQAILAQRCAEVRKGRAIVFEQIRADQEGALEAFRRSSSRDPAAFFAALGWPSSGWPDAAIYEPIVRAALDNGYAIRAGDVPRSRTRAVARGGLSMLDRNERDGLGLDQPFDSRLRHGLEAEIRDSHCGLLPEAAIGGMAIAQRYRDAHLADAMQIGRAHV